MVLLADGPARSDEDLALCYDDTATSEPGTHCLAVEVHHAAEHAGKGQIGGPAFWLSCADHPAPPPGQVLLMVGYVVVTRVAKLISHRTW